MIFFCQKIWNHQSSAKSVLALIENDYGRVTKPRLLQNGCGVENVVSYASFFEKNNFKNKKLIACKSDTAGLLKTWFSVKNFTEKLRSCVLVLGLFFIFDGLTSSVAFVDFFTSVMAFTAFFTYPAESDWQLWIQID